MRRCGCWIQIIKFRARWYRKIRFDQQQRSMGWNAAQFGHYPKGNRNPQIIIYYLLMFNVYSIPLHQIETQFDESISTMFNFGYLPSPSNNFRSLNSKLAILKQFLTKYTTNAGQRCEYSNGNLNEKGK